MLSQNGSGNLAIDIAHEGRHVADAQAFAGALTADLANQGVNAIAGPLNRTKFDREVRAYQVSSSMAQGLGLPNLTVGDEKYGIVVGARLIVLIGDHGQSSNILANHQPIR